jgi:hypothetical protein
MKISEAAAISILARYYAKQGVKAELWAQGRKVREFSASDIAKAAQVYLARIIHGGVDFLEVSGD